MLWYIRKFKDAYLVVVLGKLIENLFDKNEVETLQTLEVSLFKVFFFKTTWILTICFKVM